MGKYDVNTNPLHEIALVSLSLGFLIGTSLTAIITNIHCRFNQIYIYCLIIGTYYFSEFYFTSRYQTSKIHSRSFLIYGNNGNKQFLIIQAFSIWEYLFKRSGYYSSVFGITYKQSNAIMGLGITCSIVGMLIRYWAMKTCGESFSHIITTSPNANSSLVTSGPYQWSRHPSYLGFWLMAVGMQLLLENYVCVFLVVMILSYFFKVRIEYEEWFLIHRLYGEEYKNYKKSVGVGIPFVYIKKDN